MSRKNKSLEEAGKEFENENWMEQMMKAAEEMDEIVGEIESCNLDDEHCESCSG